MTKRDRSPQRLRSTLEAVQRRDLLNAEELRALIDRSRGREGRQKLSQAIAQLTDEAPWTQSELERRMRRPLGSAAA